MLKQNNQSIVKQNQQCKHPLARHATKGRVFLGFCGDN